MFAFKPPGTAMPRPRNGEGPGLLSAGLVLLAALATAAAIILTTGSTAGHQVRASAPGVVSSAAQMDVDTVRRMLEAAGFVAVGNVRRRGQHFTADGATAAGGQARIVVSGSSGAIIGIKMLEGSRVSLRAMDTAVSRSLLP